MTRAVGEEDDSGCPTAVVLTCRVSWFEVVKKTPKFLRLYWCCASSWAFARSRSYPLDLSREKREETIEKQPKNVQFRSVLLSVCARVVIVVANFSSVFCFNPLFFVVVCFG